MPKPATLWIIGVVMMLLLVFVTLYSISFPTGNYSSSPVYFPLFYSALVLFVAGFILAPCAIVADIWRNGSFLRAEMMGLVTVFIVLLQLALLIYIASGAATGR
jgi:uncharacterized membrane protein